MAVGLLFREDNDTKEEKAIAESIWKKSFISKYRSQIPSNSTVIGRYSVLPFYKELEDELLLQHSHLINTYTQHQYIADVMAWYQDIAAFTPKTWDMWGHLTEGQWVVKGKTNSRKFQWDTMMFADGRDQLIDVVRKLMIDPLIKDQGLVVREYVPLRQLDESINGLPVCAEWRCFFMEEQLVAADFYWASHSDVALPIPREALELVYKVANIISKKAKFFVIDVAEKKEGGFIIIEINDGQMSGLSLIDPEMFYTNLFKVCV